MMIYSNKITKLPTWLKNDKRCMEFKEGMQYKVGEQKKKILMISEIVTHPHDGGNRHRIYEEVRRLKELGHTVDYLFFGNSKFSRKEMIGFFGQSHFHYLKLPGIEVKYQIKQEIRDYIDKKQISRKFALKYSLDEWYRKEIGEKALRLHRQNQYDIIWVQYIFYSKVLEVFPDDVVKIIDLHDRFSNRDKVFQKNGNIPNYYYTTIHGEKKGLRRADFVLAIQDVEQKFFKKLLKNSHTEVLTLGDMLSLKETAVSSRNVIGFIGGHNNAKRKSFNSEGVKWFIEKVLPILKEQKLDYEIWFAGDVCRMIPDSTEYVKLGRVSDIHEFYRQVKICINPVQGGTGLNIKSIEALGYTKPLVTTAVGAKGIHADYPVYLMSDEPGQFAAHIASLLLDTKRCEELKENCKKYIIEYNRKNELALQSILEDK